MNNVETQELPTRLPDTIDELTEAVQLLGEYVMKRGALRPVTQARLFELVGHVPDVDRAAAWKTELKQALREHRAELQTTPQRVQVVRTELLKWLAQRRYSVDEALVALGVDPAVQRALLERAERAEAEVGEWRAKVAALTAALKQDPG